MSGFDIHDLLAAVRDLHDAIRDDVVAACERSVNDTDLAAVQREGSGDTQYVIDGVAEDTLIERVTRSIAVHEPVELIAEGLEPDGRRILPEGTDPSEVRWRLLIDPIDGTRGLMYQKRSAWILTSIASAEGGGGRQLRECTGAVMTEIPLVKQHLCDQLSATRGGGMTARRINRLTGTSSELALRPSTAKTLEHGFAQISRFFPGGREWLAALDDEVMADACGEAQPGKVLCFEDQYLSTGGQFYELIAGHDRFIADLRPLLGSGTLCSHPYDCAALLIAEEAGVIITDAEGEPLDAPLDIESDVAWAGYANTALRDLVEPSLRKALRRRGVASTEPATRVETRGIAEAAIWQGANSIHVARAPGRLDWLGGIADYSGSLVLQLPLAEAVTAAVQLSGDDSIELVSLVDGEDLTWSGSWQSLGGPRDLPRLKETLGGEWPAYLLGVAAVLSEWSGKPAPGFRAQLVSSVPVGKGVASSAAIEVATLRALASAQGIELDGPTLGRLAQRAENRVVGAPCGIMDQITTACGEAGRLVALRCQPAEIEASLDLTAGLQLWAIDSGVRHAVGGADYGSVRCAAFMGKKILRLTADDWLANMTPSLWAEQSESVPETILGADFLEQWGEVDDALSTVDRTQNYAVRACTAHPIHENHRIREVAAMLGMRKRGLAPLIGEAMYQSHASYSACGLGNAATDAIVAAVRATAGDGGGPADGATLYGAKITGGGSGGAVAILGESSAAPIVERIAAEHAERFGGGRIMTGSSDGAARVEVVVLPAPDGPR